MSLDGNGTYQPPAPQFPAIPNTIIYADDFNQIILDIATALSTAIFRDGQAAFTANQSMGGNKLTNLANGTNPQDAVTFLQVFTDPTFTGTTVDGVKVTGTRITISTATAVLPAGTSIGAVTAADIATIPGLAPKDSPAFTGIPTAPTAVSGTATTQLATTEFVMQEAFNSALPFQGGNAGKFVTTDGTNASWVDIPPPVGSDLYLANNFGGL